MLLLILFAFLAGVVTILSPCILPILPIVLSGSIGEGKRRPLGIVTGFVASFTFFTLFLATLVKLTGISADVLRTISVVVIFVFGASLLIPQFQIVLEKLFSKLSTLVSSKNNDRHGFVGGVVLGLSLGLIWTPCVGPIIASVITLAATSTVNLSAVLITLAYSIGTALPMLAIVYGGRQLLQMVPGLLSHTSLIQKIFGIIMIITALGIFFNIDRQFQTYILRKFPGYGVGLTSFEDKPFVRNALEQVQQNGDTGKTGRPMFEFFSDDAQKAPELIVGGQWFNTEPLTLESLRGKVVLIDFWTYTCINCERTLPYLKSWHEKYSDKGLVIIGVHAPEFEFEKNPKNVSKALEDFGITYPVMQDNEFATWKAYQNNYWPAKYLIDKDGVVRYTHFGEKAYDETEQKIQELLSETGAQVSDMTIQNSDYQTYAQTPELYLGYARIAGLKSPEKIVFGKEVIYSIPENLSPDSFAFDGPWVLNEERAMPRSGTKLRLNFEAREVFLVMRPSKTAGRVRVLLDGQPVGTVAETDVTSSVVTIDSDRLYRIIRLPQPGQHILQLEFLDEGIELFAFTFG